MAKTTELYVARSPKAAAVTGEGAALHAGAAAAAGFEITVRFLGGLNKKQKDAFKKAADRWTKVIVGSLPPVQVDGEVIKGVLITAAGEAIDGPGQILGQAGPTRLRPSTAGKAALLRPRARWPSTPPTWRRWRPTGPSTTSSRTRWAT